MKKSNITLVVICVFVLLFMWKLDSVREYKLDLFRALVKTNQKENYTQVPDVQARGLCRYEILDRHTDSEMLFSLKDPSAYYTEEEVDFITGKSGEKPCK